jgi:exonuclease SbcC
LLGAIAAAQRAAPVTAADRAADAAALDETAVMRRHDRARDAVPFEDRPELGLAGSHDLDPDAGLFSLDEDGGAYIPLDDGPVIRASAAAARERAGTMAALVEESAVQDREFTELDAAQQLAAALDAELAGLDLALAELPSRVAAGEQAVVRARAAVSGLSGWEKAAAAADAVHRAAQSAIRLEADLARAGESARTAIEHHQRAVDVRQQLVDQRFADMAGELAASLGDGTGCPVCGSKDHPAPAARTAEPVDDAVLRDAQSVEVALAGARTAAQDRLAALRVELAAAEAIAGGLSAGAAAAALRDAQAVLAEGRTVAAALPSEESELARAVALRDELAIGRTDVAARRQALAGSIAALETSVAARGERLAAAAFPFPTVVAHRDRLAWLAEALDAWAAAADDLDRARALRRHADQELAKAVADAGFASVTEARQAATLDLTVARAAVQAYDGRVASLTSRLADTDLAAADPDGIRIDLPGLRAEVARLAAEAEAAANRASAARSRCGQVGAAVGRISAARAVAEPVIDGAARLAALADAVAGRGQNFKALSLRSYVLAARLRQVAAVASQRLKRMSDGRYEFVHSQERESRGRSGGLGIDILDGYTGIVRPAKTLSGGESFLASLALALGLADVVASESGARMLDTIVIDEGFGALDSDTLELVMATLDDLRAGGRVVGIVSHVDELRQRIPSRLRVRKGVSGSTVEMTT